MEHTSQMGQSRTKHSTSTTPKATKCHQEQRKEKNKIKIKIKKIKRKSKQKQNMQKEPRDQIPTQGILYHHQNEKYLAS